MISSHRLPLVLLVALGASLVLAWTVPDLRWVAPAPIRPEIAPLVNPAPAATVDGSGEALARPPFWASRRPAPDAPAGAPAGDLAELNVVGLIRLGEQAVLIATHADRTVRLTAGQSYADWRFDGVEGDLALFSRGDSERQSLRIPRRRVDDLPQRETK